MLCQEYFVIVGDFKVPVNVLKRHSENRAHVCCCVCLNLYDDHMQAICRLHNLLGPLLVKVSLKVKLNATIITLNHQCLDTTDYKDNQVAIERKIILN